MDNATYTQGPWDFRPTGWKIHPFVIHSNSRTGALALIPARSSVPLGEQSRNARLIAAAPELLASLEAILPDLICTIREVIDNGGSEAWISEAMARAAMARTAIDKAKGSNQ